MKKLTIIATILLTANLLFGQINKIDTSFYSEALEEEKMVDIYLPPGYNENPNLYYPVIYYLHAWGGNQNIMGVEMISLVQSMINNGTIDPVIMVGADNSPGPFNGSMYVNSILWGNYEDYMVNDLVNWVDSSFRTIPERNARALLGHSMGSYGSFRYGILHKDKFRVLAATSGELSFDIDLWLEPGRQQIIIENQPGPPYFYNFATDGFWTKGAFLLAGAFTPDTNSLQNFIYPQVVNLYLDENAELIDSIVTIWQTFDILQLIHQLSPTDSVGIYFGCGTNDEWLLYPAHLALKDTLDTLQLPYEFYSHNGGHFMPDAFKQRALTFIDSIMLPPRLLTGFREKFDQSDHTDLYVFPNPVKNTANVKITMCRPADAEIGIYNLTGNLVKPTIQKRLKSGNQQIKINIEELQAGIYFIRLQANERISTKKIIKIK